MYPRMFLPLELISCVWIIPSDFRLLSLTIKFPFSGLIPTTMATCPFSGALDESITTILPMLGVSSFMSDAFWLILSQMLLSQNPNLSRYWFTKCPHCPPVLPSWYWLENQSKTDSTSIWSRYDGVTPDVCCHQLAVGVAHQVTPLVPPEALELEEELLDAVHAF